VDSGREIATREIVTKDRNAGFWPDLPEGWTRGGSPKDPTGAETAPAVFRGAVPTRAIEITTRGQNLWGSFPRAAAETRCSRSGS